MMLEQETGKGKFEEVHYTALFTFFPTPLYRL